MGHRNSSAHTHDAGGFCSDRTGVARAAEGPSLKATHSSLHLRSVRKSADREENTAAIALGMTAFLQRGGRKGARQAASGSFFTESVSRATAWLLLAAIRFYQAVFAPVMPVGCKFYPSCSHYAAEAIARHGALRGGRLALARLWRCRPFTQGGVDPVPDLVSDRAEPLDHRAGTRASSEVRW
jgi:uncharacterized protein